MNTIELLKKAIDLKKPISFEYNKEGKVKGERIGNTHAVFIYAKTSWREDTKAHIVQTEWVTDSRDKSYFPEFWIFNIENIINVNILDDRECFSIDDRYNPKREKYNNAIKKI